MRLSPKDCPSVAIVYHTVGQILYDQGVHPLEIKIFLIKIREILPIAYELDISTVKI